MQLLDDLSFLQIVFCFFDRIQVIKQAAGILLFKKKIQTVLVPPVNSFRWTSIVPLKNGLYSTSIVDRTSFLVQVCIREGTGLLIMGLAYRKSGILSDAVL